MAVVRHALVVALALLHVPVLLRAQISPGPLARPHAALEGARQCVKCHAGGRGTKEQMTGLCLDCHKEIAWLSERSRGLHGTRAVKAQRCASCHPEHAGLDFAMVSWDEGAYDRFDHARAGWRLEGSHARQKCAACHKAAYRVSRAARLLPARRPGTDPGWLGLEPTCTSCHEDAHRGALDRNCLKCHDVEHWKPAPRFDHAKTKYPLTGAHDSVSCAACHNAPRLQLASDARGRPIPRYRPLEHRECSACHTDVHRGRLGNACSRCHQTSSFTTLNRGSFDHDRTRFPLRGLHVNVRCEQCHDFSGGQVARSPSFATCNGCHTPDPHAGTATLAGRTVDCSSCHAVDGWRPSLFTVAQHRQTRYPLEGRHAQARCADCHVKTQGAGAGGVVAMRPATNECVSCHIDPHASRLPRCNDCHDLQGFRPAKVAVAEHQRFRFALEGAHRAVPCVDCHDAMKRRDRSSTLKLAWRGAPITFAAPPGGCAGCHADPHGGQFARRAGGRAGTCETCHDVVSFRPARRFDHNRDAAFSLKGAHTGVPCERCHKPQSAGAGGRAAPIIVYRPVPTACEACHK
ncbi:MAG TPA: cytochrome c3 family protein [Gemmatimonadales bacterium]|nr:cytochrome c3 family protein [Gemmatimonadales bacterium]